MMVVREGVRGVDAIADKLTFRFEKSGRMRYVSHHDLMRLFERAVRRAGLPVRTTAGFNPRPRIVFPHALGLGIASAVEWVEVEFAERVNPENALAALRSALAEVLPVHGTMRLPPVKRGRVLKTTAYVVRGFAAPSDVLAQAAAWLMAEGRNRLFREGEAEGLRADAVEGVEAGDGVVSFRIRHDVQRSVKPDEVVALLSEQLNLDRSALRVEKTDVEWK